MIDGHLAVAAAYLPRACALAGRWRIEWPEGLEDATRHYLKRELAIDLPRSDGPLEAVAREPSRRSISRDCDPRNRSSL